MNFSHILQIPPSSDWKNLTFLFLIIFILILISEFIRKKYQLNQEFTRKFIHISVGLLMLFTPMLLNTSLPLIAVALFFTVFNYFAVKKQLLPGMHIDPTNLGTVYYPLSFLILVLIFWNEYKIVIIASMMVMAIGDAAAAIVGQTVKHPRIYILISDLKTWQGSVTMFIVSSFAIFLSLFIFAPGIQINQGISFLIWLSIAISITATAAESLGNRGNDNLLVPILSGFILFLLLTGNRSLYIQFSTGLILAFGASFCSYKLKLLSPSGAVSTFILAAVIFGFGGWKWTVPILSFFLFSSLISRSGKMRKEAYHLIFEKGYIRDHGQVFANGGVAGMLMICYALFREPQIYLIYLGALAAAMADTWATETGILSKQRPRLISNFKRVDAGTSGGVTFYGLTGALTGAALLTLSGFFFFRRDFQNVEFLLVWVIIFSGLLGSLLDSFLGATIQVQYRCPSCNKITEKQIHCGDKPTVAVKGIQWMNNDMVNFLNTIGGSLTVFLIIHFL